MKTKQATLRHPAAVGALVRLSRLPIGGLLVFLCLSMLLISAPRSAHAEDAVVDSSVVEAAATGDAVPEADEHTRSVAVNPIVGERLLRANGYLEKSRFDDALSVVDELARMRKLKPVDLAQIHRFRGYILIAKNDPDSAAKEFEAALAQDALEDNARQAMIYTLAQIFTQDGKYDRALQLMDDWFRTESDPKAEAYYLKAMILVQQEDWKGALEPTKAAIAKAGAPRESWLQLLAAIQFQVQDMEGLASTLEQLVAVSPGSKRYWTQLATIQNALGREDEALATLGVAHVGDLLTEDKEIRQRARMCFVRELPSCCVETLEDGMAKGLVKPDAEAWRLLANCHIAARDFDEALEPLAKAGELADNAQSFLLLGQLQLQRERFAPARDALSKALVKAGANEKASIQLLLGVAQLGLENFSAADEAFRAASLDPKSAAAAEAYRKHLEQKKALAELKEGAVTASAN